MMRRRHHPASTLTTARLEAFTDGVFAIAATLLVLSLTDHPLADVESDAEMWAALGGMGQIFVSFTLSFALLCLLWMVHVQQFEHVVRVDKTMIWLNSARLLFIVLVPFATSLATSDSGELAGRVAIPVTFFLAILCSYLQWAWAVRNRDVMMPDLDQSEAVALGRGALSAVIISGIVVLLAPWIGSWAFLLFLLDPLLTRALRGQGA